MSQPTLLQCLRVLNGRRGLCTPACREKVPGSGLTHWLALTAALVWGGALAVPRIGLHEGSTRLVFTLPGVTTQHTVLNGLTATVTLGRSLPRESRLLKVPDVIPYAVAGRVITLGLAAGVTQVKTSLLPAGGGQPARLIIDVPLPVSAPRAAQPPVIRPASTRATTASRPRVVLDPGHGGNDPGMISAWVREADVNLAVALMVRDELTRHGVDVIMTRTTDQHLSPDKRTDLDRRSRLASTGSVSAFLSIHTNAADSRAQGIETFYFGMPLVGQVRSTAVFENGGGQTGEALTRSLSTSAQSMLGDILAQAKLTFSRQLAQTVQSGLILATRAQTRGVKTDVFYVIRNPTTPAVLVELGFGSHPVEGSKLAQLSYQRTLAHALATSMLRFLHLN